MIDTSMSLICQYFDIMSLLLVHIPVDFGTGKEKTVQLLKLGQTGNSVIAEQILNQLVNVRIVLGKDDVAFG